VDRAGADDTEVVPPANPSRSKPRGIGPTANETPIIDAAGVRGVRNCRRPGGAFERGRTGGSGAAIGSVLYQHKDNSDADRLIASLEAAAHEKPTDSRRGLEMYQDTVASDGDSLDAFCRVDILLKLVFERPRGPVTEFRMHPPLGDRRADFAPLTSEAIEYCVPVEFDQLKPRIAWLFASYEGPPLRADFRGLFDECCKKFSPRMPGKTPEPTAGHR